VVNRKNEIKDDQGILTQDPLRIKEIRLWFFQRLLSMEEALNKGVVEEILGNIPKLQKSIIKY